MEIFKNYVTRKFNYDRWITHSSLLVSTQDGKRVRIIDNEFMLCSTPHLLVAVSLGTGQEQGHTYNFEGLIVGPDSKPLGGDFQKRERLCFLVGIEADIGTPIMCKHSTFGWLLRHYAGKGKVTEGNTEVSYLEMVLWEGFDPLLGTSPAQLSIVSLESLYSERVNTIYEIIHGYVNKATEYTHESTTGNLVFNFLDLAHLKNGGSHFQDMIASISQRLGVSFERVETFQGGSEEVAFADLLFTMGWHEGSVDITMYDSLRHFDQDVQRSKDFYKTNNGV